MLCQSTHEFIGFIDIINVIYTTREKWKSVPLVFLGIDCRTETCFERNTRSNKRGWYTGTTYDLSIYMYVYIVYVCISYKGGTDAICSLYSLEALLLPLLCVILCLPVYMFCICRAACFALSHINRHSNGIAST